MIVLSNRVHPDGTGDSESLAGRIGTVAVAALSDAGWIIDRQLTSWTDRVRNRLLSGIDVIEAHQFADLAGAKWD